MLYMVIERFRDPRAVYRRLREEGRGLPDGLRYLNSWVTPELERCFQVMETDDLSLLEKWLASWADLAEFEVVPVITSDDAAGLAEGSSL